MTFNAAFSVGANAMATVVFSFFFSQIVGLIHFCGVGPRALLVFYLLLFNAWYRVWNCKRMTGYEDMNLSLGSGWGFILF
jgi:hypothetical protein